MSQAALGRAGAVHGALRALTVEGLRLFFPLGALYAMLMPLVWVAVYRFELPLARAIPATQWHAHEMVFGVLCAVLAGFLTSAVPEWTDTARRRGRALGLLAALWLPGRLIGLLGADALVVPALLTDAAFLGLLLWYAAEPMIAKRSARHVSLPAWLAVLLACEIAVRIGWLAGDWAIAARALHAAVCAFVVLFALALGRINVAVLNLALDPSGETTPYRPHPGRQNLAAGMVALYIVAATFAPQSAVAAWLALAAAAAFLDRLAEWFVGRAALAAHVLALAAANALAAAGFAAIGLAGLGAPIGLAAGMHVLTVGALGLAVLSVFSIAGLRHTGRTLVLPWQARAALALVMLAAAARVVPGLFGLASATGSHYLLAALAWSVAFAVWLHGYLPYFLAPAAPARDRC
ncbi:MAG: NnrS family protein [Burkholderiales bacterium]|nr:NnrS family protein [Burkholderiales bacterium]